MQNSNMRNYVDEIIKTEEMRNSMNNNLFHAIQYLKNGFSIIPLSGKRPLIEWKEFQTRMPAESEVKIWFETWPDAGLGIVTGTISGYLSVLDIDDPEWAEHLIKKEFIGDCTRTVKTPGGGLHIYFRSLAKETLKSRPVSPGFADIKSEGGYVVAPPSAGYVLLNEEKDEPLRGWDVLREIEALLPKNLLNPPKSTKPKIESGSDSIGPGERNSKLASLAGSLRLRGFGFEDILSALVSFNVRRCNPPLEPVEVEQIARSICKYEKGEPLQTKAEEIQEEKPEEIIDPSKFKPIFSQELSEVLGLTIKKDESNKLITFLCQLSTYTESSQLNISFNAPSSTGKSYIPTEIAKFFPARDVLEVGYCSPTAFFHDVGHYDKEKNQCLVDLSKKILIFLDQPHNQLLEHLRPLLSHDKKEIQIKITDKSNRGGLKTKNILLRGYPSVIFCTAGLNIDEQESTRFILLSPETNQEKIRLAIKEKIRRETNPEDYRSGLNSHPQRVALKDRILAIKQANIGEVRIKSSEKIEELFLRNKGSLKPRHQRDIGRVLSLIKAFALLNLFFREREGATLVANDQDVADAFALWGSISESQELNLPPYVYQIYNEIIVPLYQTQVQFEEAPEGIPRGDILEKHFAVYGRPLQEFVLRRQILPMLENAGLISQEPDPGDKRRFLIIPTTSSALKMPTNNCDSMVV